MLHFYPYFANYLKKKNIAFLTFSKPCYNYPVIFRTTATSNITLYRKINFLLSWNVTELAFFHEHVQTKQFQKAIVKYFIEIRNLQDNKHFCHIWCSRVFKTRTKISIVNVWLGYKYASVIKFWPWIKFCMRCLNFIILRA